MERAEQGLQYTSQEKNNHETAGKRKLFDRFSIHSFLFTLAFDAEVALPKFKGDLLHRALGRALAQNNPRAGRFFFSPDIPQNWQARNQTPPKPFRLTVANNTKTHFEPGETLKFGITLFGHAHFYLMTLFDALEALGVSEGIVPGKGRFRIQHLQQCTVDHTVTLFTDNRWHAYPAAFETSHIIQNLPDSRKTITLTMRSPVQIVKNGKVISNNLTLPDIIERLTSRINALAATYGDGAILSPQERSVLIALARDAQVKQDGLHYQQWLRRKHSRDAMKFTGLSGKISFDRVPPALLPWLALGEWIGVGRKTSFGLGNYSLELET